MATPSVLAEMTPGRTPLVKGTTPGGRSVAATPLRDQFGLNTGDVTAMVIADPRADKLRQQQAAYSLKKSFMSLPAPEDKYDIVTADTVPDVADNNMDIEEDEADRIARM